jgi:O-antigen ligase
LAHALTHRRPDTRATRAAGALSEAVAAVARLPVPVLIYVLCVVFPVSVRAGPVLLTSVRLFLIVMIIPLTIRLLMGKYGRVIATDILFFCHILWATVALAVNNPDRVIEQAGSVGIEFIGGYVLGRAYIRSPEAFLGLCRLLVGLVLILLPFAIVEAVTNRHPLLEILGALPIVATIAESPSDPRFGFNRVQGTFAHAIHFGLFCSIVMSLCIVGMKGMMSDARRVIYGLLILFTGFLALSSAAVSALALQLGLILWALIFHRLQWRWWLLLGLFVLAYIVVDLLSNRTPIRVFLSYMTFSPATAYWRLLISEFGMENVWANPIFGLGLNDWARPEWMHTSSVDNFWLLMAMRYGIPGFALLALGYIIVLWRVMGRDLTGDTQLIQLRQAWMFTFMGLSFMLFTVHVWGNMYSFVFFMFGAGIWFLEATPRQEATGTAQEGPRSDSSLRVAIHHSPAPAADRKSRFTRF